MQEQLPRSRIIDSEELLTFVTQQGLEKNQREALEAVFRKMLEFFNCDRAYCMYPCDPETSYWGVPVEATRYAWPGVNKAEIDMPTAESDKANFQLHLNANGPVTYGKNADYPIPDYLTEVFGIKSQISCAIYPEKSKPWVLGIHYCESHHHFTDDEIAFFDTLGKQISSAFYTLAF